MQRVQGSRKLAVAAGEWEVSAERRTAAVALSDEMRPAGPVTAEAGSWGCVIVNGSHIEVLLQNLGMVLCASDNVFAERDRPVGRAGTPKPGLSHWDSRCARNSCKARSSRSSISTSVSSHVGASANRPGSSTTTVSAKVSTMSRADRACTHHHNPPMP